MKEKKLPRRKRQEKPAIWQREKMKMEGNWFAKNGALDGVSAGRVAELKWGITVESAWGSTEREGKRWRERVWKGRKSWDSWTMKTGMKDRHELDSAETFAELEDSKKGKKLESLNGMEKVGDYIQSGSPQRLKSGHRKRQKSKEKLERAAGNTDAFPKQVGGRRFPRPLFSGRSSYLGRRWSHRSCCRDASLDRYVAAGCCHGNCNWGG